MRQLGFHGVDRSLAPKRTGLLQHASESAVPVDFVSLGFDVVSKSTADSFECSPLSCNLLSNEEHVNCFCLVDNLDEAIELAERFAREEPEPCPYFVVEVLREGEILERSCLT